MYDNIIIGAGPAGLMCANTVKGVTLLIDKNQEIGKKLLLTGNGRCNVTNMSDLDELKLNIHNYKFLYSTLTRFSNYEIINFFNSKGLELKEEDHGRMFPVTDKASDVLDALTKDLTCAIKTDCEVQEIQKIGNSFIVTTSSGEYMCNNLIIATGGVSYPQTGSSGFGHQIARQFGHTITTLISAEAALYSEDQICTDLQGITLEHAALIINKKKFSGYNLLFTHFGLSGPLAMRSAFLLNSQSINDIKIDFIPAYNEEELKALFHLNLATILKPFLPKSFVKYLCSRLELNSNDAISTFSNKQKHDLIQFLKYYPVNIYKTADVEKSFVTAGGINIKEINPKTFMSNKVDNLYFIGEVIDVHAHTGGYNLTINFSMGHSCGENL